MTTTTQQTNTAAGLPSLHDVRHRYPRLHEIDGALDWFKQFDGCFIVITGRVVSVDPCLKDERWLNYVGLSDVQLKDLYPLSGEVSMRQWQPEFHQVIYIETATATYVGESIWLQVVPHHNDLGQFKVAHDSATLSRNTTIKRLFKCLLAEVELADWDLSDSKTAVNRLSKKLNWCLKYPFTFKGRHKMTRVVSEGQLIKTRGFAASISQSLKQSLRNDSLTEFKQELFHWMDRLEISDEFLDWLASSPDECQRFVDEGMTPVTRRW